MMPDAASSLFPGHNHVEHFSEALGEDYDEEISYVTLDFGTIDPGIIASAQFYALIGLDTDMPMIQLGSMIFKGTYQNLLGSELLLSESPSGEKRKPQLLPFDITSGRRIRFREVHLERKKENGSPGDPQNVRHGDESRDSDGDMQPETFYPPETSASGARGKGKGVSRGRKK